jgi:plastocyanin
MKTCLPCLTVAMLAGSLQFVVAGEITGKITLKGTPKNEIPIDLGPSCSKHNPNKVTTRHYVVSKDGGLANVFVYLKDAKPAPAAAEGPVLDQIGCMYEPYVMGVVVGQKFKVKNSDPELHNVHATPKLNKEFNFAQPTKGLVSEKSFDQPEVLVRMKCDVHPWMFAYIGVCEHPYFAVTDKEGNFKIAGVPDGKYTLVAYHLKTHGANPGLTQSVDLKGTAKQDFTVELPAAP